MVTNYHKKNIFKEHGKETKPTRTMNDGLYISESGHKRWYLNGKFHREDGPAVQYSSGSKFWYLNGLQHRTDGPAVEYPDGTKRWYLNDELHRTDGPAVEYINGTKRWWINGNELSQTQYLQRTREKKLNLLGL